MLPFIVTQPASEPVTLAEAKSQLTLEGGLDDTFVTALITVARMWAEEHCWRGFVTQTWELQTDCFPQNKDDPEREGLELPKGNLASITSVKYLSAVDGSETTLAGGGYEADTVSVPGRLRRAYGVSWPSHRSTWNAVRVRYVVGWAAADVPAPIKQAILMLVSQMYEHRTPEVTGTIISAVGFAVNALLGPYRLVRFS